MIHRYESVSCKKIDLLFSRSKSLQVQEFIWSNYDNFYCIFWTTEHFVTKLGMAMQHHEPEWAFCYQTWFHCTLSLARVSYGEIGLLCSESRSQQSFKMLMNVCPDDIFLIAEPFTTKLGRVMHHYEPDCLPERLVCCLQVQGHSEGSYNQKCDFLICHLNCWSFCSWAWFDGTSS